MKVTTKSSTDLKLILAGMVTDTVVLSRIASQWDRDQGLFASEDENQIASWCISYLNRYGKAPNMEIKSIFNRWAEKDSVPEELAERVDMKLRAVSRAMDRGEQPTTDYVLDRAEKHFNEVAYDRMMEKSQALRSTGEMEEAVSLVTQYKQPVSFNGVGVLASDLTMKGVRWLWRQRIPVGELTMLEGDPATGKSTLTIDIAARTSRGWKMPPAKLREKHQKSRPRNVLILSSEDTWQTTILPRLTLAGADLQRIIRPDSNKSDMEFPRDIAYVKTLIAYRNVKLVIIDPLMAFIGSSESFAENVARKGLTALRDFAEEADVAALMVRHFKKSKDTAINRGGGSIAYTAALRAVHAIGTPPNVGDGVFGMACTKINIDEKPTSLLYRIEPGQVKDSDGRRIDTSGIQWIGEGDFTADDLANPTQPRGRPNKSDPCKEYIQELLADGEEMPAKELEELVTRKFGIRESTYRKARKAAGIMVWKNWARQ